MPPPPLGSQCAISSKVAPPSRVRTPQRLPPKIALVLSAGSTATARLYQLCAWPMFAFRQSLEFSVGFTSAVVLVARTAQVRPPSMLFIRALVALVTEAPVTSAVLPASA